MPTMPAAITVTVANHIAVADATVPGDITVANDVAVPDDVAITDTVAVAAETTIHGTTVARTPIAPGFAATAAGIAAHHCTAAAATIGSAPATEAATAAP